MNKRATRKRLEEDSAEGMTKELSENGSLLAVTSPLYSPEEFHGENVNNSENVKQAKKPKKKENETAVPAKNKMELGELSLRSDADGDIGSGEPLVVFPSSSLFLISVLNVCSN